jgi:hypothetical protein
MSLPSAMKSKRAQLQAQISQAADGIGDNAQPILSVVDNGAPTPGAAEELDISLYAVNSDLAAPVADPPNTSAAPTIDWEEEARKNEKRWHTLQGLYERERLEREALEARINGGHPLPAQAPAGQDNEFLPVSFDLDDPELELTDDEKTTYAESFSVIQKAAKREAMKLVKTAIEPLNREIQQLRGASRKIDDMTEKAFLASVRKSVGDLDNLTSSAAWKDHASSRVPFTGLTVGQALMQAHNARDLDRVTEIFDGFRSKATSNVVASLTAPAVAGATAIPRQANGNKAPNLKWSERTNAHKAFVKGQISIERLNQIDALYKKADSEGRIDYNS